jgi:hypothetical protein
LEYFVKCIIGFFDPGSYRLRFSDDIGPESLGQSIWREYVDRNAQQTRKPAHSWHGAAVLGRQDAVVISRWLTPSPRHHGVERCQVSSRLPFGKVGLGFHHGQFFSYYDADKLVDAHAIAFADAVKACPDRAGRRRG